MATDEAVPTLEMPQVSQAIELNDRLPTIDASDIEPHFRAVAARAGERRGIRLERIYWEGLRRISAESGMTTADIVQRAAMQVPESANLASLLRVISFKWALRRLTQLEEKTSLNNLNAIVQASPAPTIVMTRERKILLFNDPFLSMLRNRFSLGEVQQLARGLKFLIDTHVDEALDTFERNQGTIIKTSFTVSLNLQSMRGKINIAPAPSHEKSMLIGYVSGF